MLLSKVFGVYVKTTRGAYLGGFLISDISSSINPSNPYVFALSIFATRIGFMSSVQTSKSLLESPFIILDTPVIKEFLLKLSTPFGFVDCRTTLVWELDTSYSTTKSLLSEVINQYSFSLEPSDIAPIVVAFTRAKLVSFSLPLTFSRAPTSEPSEFAMRIFSA